MSDETILYQVHERIATIALNRSAARNALNEPMLAELSSALKSAAGDANVHVVVLTGTGDKAFCSGADLSTLGRGQSVLEHYQGQSAFLEVLQNMAALGKPILAAVNGHAMAGGLGLALGCDLAIAAERAAFGLPEIRAGLFPMMVMALLFRNVGRKKGMELMLTGERISAREAERIGLINRAVPDDQFDGAVQEMAAKLARFSPTTLRLGLTAFHTMADMDLSAALAYLRGMLLVNVQTEDAGEGVRAYLEKREPVWTERWDKGKTR